MSYLGWKFPFSTSNSKSPQPATPEVVKRRTPVARSHSFSGYRSSPRNIPSSAGPLLSVPFLPTVKRVLGLNNVNKTTISHIPEVPAIYPNKPVSGYMPAVRLRKHDKYGLPQRNMSLIRSPNTVKIAPPEHGQLSSPRLFQMKHSNLSQKSDFPKTPNTQAVVTALKEKSRKRSFDGLETTLSDVPAQHSKRRRQESQQSNASTSSLPPLPESLPDLSTQGYTIPRLETPTLKRSAEVSDLDDQEWDQENTQSAKKARVETKYNSIASSLSSSKRFKERELQKRKRMSEERDYRHPIQKQWKKEMEKSLIRSDVPFNRMDTLILPPELNESFGNQSNSLNEPESDPPVTKSETKKPAPVQKRVPLNESFSAKKSQMSLFSGANKSFQKVPQSSVIAHMEDYEKDREAEQNRAKEMLEDIDKEEKEKVKKAEEKQSGGIQQLTSLSSVSTEKTGLSSKLPTLSSTVVSSSTDVSSISTSSTLSSQFSFTSSATAAVSSVTTKNDGATSKTVSENQTVSTPISAVTSVTPTASVAENVVTTPKAENPLTSLSSSVKPTVTSGQSDFNFSTIKSLPTSKPDNPLSAPKMTFKPVFGTAPNSSAPTSLATSPGYAGFNLPGQSSGLTTTTVSSTFGGGISSVGNASTTQTITGSAFKSVFPSTTTPSGASGFSLTSPKSTSANQTGIAFSLPISSSNGSSQAGFTFGQTNPGAFTLGATTPSTAMASTTPSATVQTVAPAATSNSAVSGFSFGQTANTTTSTVSSNPNMFSFGQGNKAPVPKSSTGLSFSQASSTTTSTSTATAAFSFGQSSAAPATTNISFGQSSAAPATTNISFGQSSAAPATTNISFGQSSATPATTNISFGQTAPAAMTQSATAGFNFGQSQATTFGQTSTPQTTTSASNVSFNFGQNNTSFGANTAAPAFASPPSTQAAFQFGKQPESSAPSTTSVFAFGSQNSVSTSKPTTGINFGGATQSTGASFSFGSSQPASGNSATPVFGATSTSSQPAFGAPTTSSTPVFGSTGTSQTSSVSGFGSQSSGQLNNQVFGKQSSVPVFGASQTTATQGTGFASGSSFGQQNTGGQSNIVFTFGQQPSTTQSNSVFGTTNTQASSNPVFGASTNSGPVFGQGNLNSSFSSSNTGSGTANFNFGMSTPQKGPQNSTPFAFGASTPQNQVRPPLESTPSTGQKGFDFAGAGNAAPNFNFGATANTSFGASPGFGASTPSFNVGTGGTAKRAMAKAKRRSNRR